MLELLAPVEITKEARTVVEDEGNILGIWTGKMDDGRSVLRVLINVNRTEALSDLLTDKFSDAEGFRIMLFEVETTLPQPKPEEVEKQVAESKEQHVDRISREELYTKISTSSELNWIYIAMVILSTLVAGVGLIYDDVAVIIGAMVIAPLLGPNVSLALAATLADLDLGWRSLKANAAGLLVSLAVAFVMGYLFQVSLESEQIMKKTVVSWGNIVIALAAGSAGVLSYTRGVPAAIVGVMVAVALLPPLVNAGLLLGEGYMTLATGSAILTVTNLICINLAGILTFLVQDIRPRSWWEAQKAKQAVRKAILIWVGLLVGLGVIIWYWNLVNEPV